MNYSSQYADNLIKKDRLLSVLLQQIALHSRHTPSSISEELVLLLFSSSRSIRLCKCVKSDTSLTPVRLKLRV